VDAKVTYVAKLEIYYEVIGRSHTPEEEGNALIEANHAAEDFGNDANDSCDKWSKALNVAHAAAGRVIGTVFEGTTKDELRKYDEGLTKAEGMRTQAKKEIYWFRFKLINSTSA
jgi:hypothetical protein